MNNFSFTIWMPKIMIERNLERKKIDRDSLRPFNFKSAIFTRKKKRDSILE